MKKSAFRWRTLAGVVALAMVAAACSSSSKTSTTTTAPASGGSTTTTEKVAPPTGTPIKIGSTILTPEVFSAMDLMPGIVAGVDDVNAHGGINGHPLVLDFCPAADANASEACARKMESDGVVATVADANFLSEAQTTQILADAGIPQIDPFLAGTEAMNSKNVFMLDPGLPLTYAAVVGSMKQQGLENLYVLSAGVPQSAPNVDATNAAAKYFGITVKGKTEIPLTATDDSPYVGAANDAGADLNMAIFPPFMTGLFLQAIQQLGTPLKLGAVEGQVAKGQYKQFLQSGGPLEGSIMASTVPPVSAADKFPEVARALAAMQAFAKSGKQYSETAKRRQVEHDRLSAVVRNPRVRQGCSGANRSHEANDHERLRDDEEHRHRSFEAVDAVEPGAQGLHACLVPVAVHQRDQGREVGALPGPADRFLDPVQTVR